MNKLTTKEVIRRAKVIHGDNLDYSETVYVDYYTPIIIKCNTCNSTNTIRTTIHIGNTPSTQKGCRTCAIAKRSAARKKPLDTLILEYTTKHPGKYIYCYDADSYIGTLGDIQLKCLRCSTVFTQNVKSHGAGKGCSKCAQKGIDYSKPTMLYYISINNGEYYKIGITNYTPERRFAKETADLRTIKSWEYPIGRDALRKEQEIRKRYRQFITTDKVLADGNSEIFTCDVLELDF